MQIFEIENHSRPSREDSDTVTETRTVSEATASLPTDPIAVGNIIGSQDAVASPESEATPAPSAEVGLEVDESGIPKTPSIPTTASSNTVDGVAVATVGTWEDDSVDQDSEPRHEKDTILGPDQCPNYTVPFEGGSVDELGYIHLIARGYPKHRFCGLLDEMTGGPLHWAFDAVTRYAYDGSYWHDWAGYQKGDVGKRLGDLFRRLDRGRYQPQLKEPEYYPRRVDETSSLRFLVIEDLIVQETIRSVLIQIYKADFHAFVYGFLPEKSGHHAHAAWKTLILQKHIGSIWSAEIRSYSDSLDHDLMIKFLQIRIADSKLLNLIELYLKAGVLEDGIRARTTDGREQGGQISPPLWNVFLHYAVDEMFIQWKKTKATGNVEMLRYDCDIVVVAEQPVDLLNFRLDLYARLEEHKLKLHHATQASTGYSNSAVDASAA